VAIDAEGSGEQFNYLLDQLKDPANPDPMATAMELAGLAHPDVVPALLGLLRTDNEILVRVVATEALGKMDDPAVIPALIHALRDDVSVASRAAEALGWMGNPALQPLLRALEDADTATRRGAVWALRRQRAPQSVASLSNALADPDSSVRDNAAFALAGLGDRRAIAPSIRLLADPDWQVRGAAAEALCQFVLSEEEHAAANEVLLQELRSSEPMRRLTAARAIGRLSDRQAVPALINALRDDEEGVRTETVRALECIRDPAAISPLVDVFRAMPPVRQVASAAAHALSCFGETALPILLKATGDADANVRFWAAIALGYIGLPQVLPHLIALRDTDQGQTATGAQVRTAAGRAIRHMHKHHQSAIDADGA
jgi:HEAT repeat protein